MFSNNISKKLIQKAVPKCYIIETEKEVTSTNFVMKEMALKGAKDFSVLIASSQTSGRGRLGRSFHSPEGTGIYMSVLLPLKSDRNPLFVTVDAAVCLLRVLERVTGEKTLVKWVNDIYIRERKVCGILAEAVEDRVVLGIGINVFSPKGGFPEEIKDRAGFLFEKRTKKIKEYIISRLLCELYDIYTYPDRNKLFEEYKSRSMVIGKDIMVIENGKEETATVLGLNEDYSLMIKKENGEIVNLSTGDVSIKI